MNIACNNTPATSSRTTANQTDVSIFRCIPLTLNTTMEDTFRQLIIPFAVVDIKHNIIGTPFFEE